MDGNRRPSFKKRPNPNFNKGGNKRGRFGEQSSQSSQGSETVYRILCESRKIGSVIGKGGGVVKALREETQAKITVADSVPGSEERVIQVSSPSTKLPIINNNDMELHCASQDALLRVHDKIVEEDIVGANANGGGNEIVVMARLLVPNNTVGCLLGKKGDVITRLRSETGASIRVMPGDQRPSCALSTDELVQISAVPAVAKRALHEISTLLHQNPRKDKPPSSFQTGGGHSLHNRPGPTSFEDMLTTTLLRQNVRGALPMPWTGGYASEPSRFGPNSFNGDRGVSHGEETNPSEFSMKILCSAARIGGVIGKGGSNVRQLQQETGTNIHVDDASAESEERVIRVSSFEALVNPRSQTIDAILILQDKTSEQFEKGVISTRVLIPSSKVGCIIGQGGQVINEMRRRTKADIRVISKDDKPRCAGDDEELVQVSGSYGVAKDALGEIASRFRARCLRDVKPGEGPLPSALVRGGRSGGYEPPSFPDPPRGYEPHGYPVPPRASGYPGAVDVNAPNSGRLSGMAPGFHNITEVPGARLKLQDPYAASAEPIDEIRASNGVDVYQGYSGGSSGQNRLPQPPQVPYHNNYGTQQAPFSDINSSSHTSYQTAITTTTTNPHYQPYPPQQDHYPQTSYQYGP